MRAERPQSADRGEPARLRSVPIAPTGVRRAAAAPTGAIARIAIPTCARNTSRGAGDGGDRRDKAPDPNSPFAKLAALKEQLEGNSKEPR